MFLVSELLRMFGASPLTNFTASLAAGGTRTPDHGEIGGIVIKRRPTSISLSFICLRLFISFYLYGLFAGIHPRAIIAIRPFLTHCARWEPPGTYPKLRISLCGFKVAEEPSADFAGVRVDKRRVLAKTTEPREKFDVRLRSFTFDR